MLTASRLRFEEVDDSNAEVRALRALPRVKACQQLAREQGFRPLGTARWVVQRRAGVKEVWVDRDGATQLTISEGHYSLVTRWPTSSLLSVSNRVPLSLPHVGLDVIPRSGDFAEDLRRHAADRERRTAELGHGPRVYACHADVERAEARYWEERPRSVRLRGWLERRGPLVCGLALLLLGAAAPRLELSAGVLASLSAACVAFTLALLLPRRPLARRLRAEGVEDLAALTRLDFDRAVGVGESPQA